MPCRWQAPAVTLLDQRGATSTRASRSPAVREEKSHLIVHPPQIQHVRPPPWAFPGSHCRGFPILGCRALHTPSSFFLLSWASASVENKGHLLGERLAEALPSQGVASVFGGWSRYSKSRRGGYRALPTWPLVPPASGRHALYLVMQLYLGWRL